MKKLSIFTFAAIFSIFAISCNNGENKDKEDEKTPEKENKAQIVDLESFNEAYETLEFETCDEYGTAVDHYADVYFSTLEKACEGDEDAIAEFKKLHQMRKPFEEQAKKLEESCPDFMTELEEKYEGKLEGKRDKINKIIAPEESETDEELADVSEENPENSEDASGENQVTKDGSKKQHPTLKERKLNLDESKKSSDEEDQGIQM